MQTTGGSPRRRPPGSRSSRRGRLFNGFVILTLLISAVLLALALIQQGDEAPSAAGGPGDDPIATFAVFDVGQAMSAAVATEDGHGLIYDFGRGGDDAEQAIVPFLREHDIDEIDYAILSHPHQDHLGGLPILLEEIDVEVYLDPVIDTTNQTYLQSLEMIDERGIGTAIARQGESYTLGAHVQFEVLWPPDDLLVDADGESEVNANSTVVRVTAGDISMLLTGDIEEDAERILTDTRAGSLEADILQIPHHGSNTSSGEDFLRLVEPEVGIIPAGADNPYGHPHEEVIQRLRAHEIRIYRTDVDGTVTIETNGRSYEISTTRTVTSWTNPMSWQRWIESSTTPGETRSASSFSTVESN